jgi:hypothetical protein
MHDFMVETWRKATPDYIHVYEIDRTHNTAVVRTLSPEGFVRTINGATRQLIAGELTAEKLREMGFELKGGNNDGQA